MRFIWTERSQRSFEDIEKSNGQIVRFVPADSSIGLGVGVFWIVLLLLIFFCLLE